ncbi:MAG: GrpE protein [Chloroflexi bacterium]|nr:GrpE protein [Chloroflexota bacterium]
MQVNNMEIPKQDEGVYDISQAARSPDGPQSEEQDPLTTLESQLAAARAENEEQLRGWQRTQADFVNFRRRVEQERADFMQAAEAGLIRDILPVVDDLERALASVPGGLLGLTWVDGISLIERKLLGVLVTRGLQPIEALGKEFDPREHEAVLREGDGGDATEVTGELQKGYRLSDRVLRPTLVKVGPASKNPSN